MKIGRVEAMRRIKESKGKFFGTTFRKKNGELRTMNCRLKKEQPQIEVGYILVEDVNLTLKKKESTRIVNIQTLEKLTINGEVLKIK